MHSNYSCLLHALLLFPSIGATPALVSIHWCHLCLCWFAVPRAHRLVTAAHAHCECTSMSFIATTCYLCLPQCLWRRRRNNKLTFQKCYSLFLKSWICFIHMKLKENIECVIKSDVDCIFKCQYDFLKLWNLLG
jgi:hypothetical protein